MEEFATEEPSSQLGHEENCQFGRGKNKKQWTHEEDKALIQSLLELVDAGTHKGDNGFKSGYLDVLEKNMHSRGHTGIKANPHIISRIKYLKQHYAVYSEMLTSDGLSGFGYNSHTGCIEAPDSVWKSLSESQSKKFGKLRSKSFPYYNDLHIVFGRDQATGMDAMSFGSMVEDDENEEVADGGSSSVPVVGRTKKRKRCSPVSEKSMIASAMKVIGEKIIEAGNVLSAALQSERKMEMQKQLTRDIMKIFPFMSVEEEVFLMGKIGKDVDMLNMFNEWDDEKKERYMTQLLLGRARGSNLNDDDV